MENQENPIEPIEKVIFIERITKVSQQGQDIIMVMYNEDEVLMVQMGQCARPSDFIALALAGRGDRMTIKAKNQNGNLIFLEIEVFYQKLKAEKLPQINFLHKSANIIQAVIYFTGAFVVFGTIVQSFDLFNKSWVGFWMGGLIGLWLSAFIDGRAEVYNDWERKFNKIKNLED